MIPDPSNQTAAGTGTASACPRHQGAGGIDEMHGFVNGATLSVCLMICHSRITLGPFPYVRAAPKIFKQTPDQLVCGYQVRTGRYRRREPLAGRWVDIGLSQVNFHHLLRNLALFRATISRVSAVPWNSSQVCRIKLYWRVPGTSIPSGSFSLMVSLNGTIKFGLWINNGISHLS